MNPYESPKVESHLANNSKQPKDGWERSEKVRKPGRTRFISLRAVGYGVPLATIYSASIYYSPISFEADLIWLTLGWISWPLFGYAFGAMLWASMEKKYQAELEERKRDEPAET